MALEINQRIPVEYESDRVLLFGLSMPISLATTPMRFAHGVTIPERLWMMSSDAMDFTIRRISENKVEIQSEKGMINEFEQSVRDLSREPLKVGQVVATDGMRLEVKKLDSSGHPLLLELEFDQGHASDVVAVYWKGKEFKRARLPEVGSAIELNLAE